MAKRSASKVQTGLFDTKNRWVEVTNRRRADAGESRIHDASYRMTKQVAASGTDEARLANAGWLPLDGSEQVIVGDLSILTDGATVRVGGTVGENKDGLAEEHHGHRLGAQFSLAQAKASRE